ncbi:EF-hand domain-containing protein [Sphingomonas abietis]|uniref:EF-hand domain-containing protein n=1 Tax=Sphingomonas abietis TaxID=3012344 RepID=A0ABY7NVR8_9SPHN|nr:hypothetical protein [Sphingomonas abietis]WBO24526.1 hypothetical protein PBT88_02175 [Sphingomonas abietis]
MLLAGVALADPPVTAPTALPAGTQPAAAATPSVATPGADITVNGAAPTMAQLGGGHIFISPMGEPYHTQGGVSAAEQWFRDADANHDNRITPQEFQEDAMRFFATLDVDHNHLIEPDEIDRYESDVAPEIRVISTYGDPTLAKTDDDGNVTDPPYPSRIGAGRFGFLDAPEPVVSADLNFDRAISEQEFETVALRRFKMLDVNGDGVITRDELPRLDVHPERRNGRGNRFGQGGGHHHGHGGAGD